MSDLRDFEWCVHTEASELVSGQLVFLLEQLPALRTLAGQLREQTGTRLVDWVAMVSVPDTPGLGDSLSHAGFSPRDVESGTLWTHSGGIFPTFRLHDSKISRVTLKVDSVVDFLLAHQIRVPIAGPAWAPLRTAVVSSAGSYEFEVMERHGCNGFQPADSTPQQIRAAVVHAERFLLRQRVWSDELVGFDHANALIEAAIEDLGVDWTSALFFAAERDYWQRRNHAARVQKHRQDRLGLGWGNHDHHTYRSSREHFKSLINVLENLGLVCRERFYGGHEAGWGAQVLEQPVSGVVVFADVDLTPEEVMGDFAHDGLPDRVGLGTVGLWCYLHGEAFLEAGMHHLECQFDFERAREQLTAECVPVMSPFTDMPELKQAFTEGEWWSVSPDRLERARKDGHITQSQAAHFGAHGCLGSHLEILERNGGYRGFNQTGISDIIRKTDPRGSLRSSNASATNEAAED